MSWRDLIGDESSSLTAPWLGGRSLRVGSRAWRLSGGLPPDPGWHRFSTAGRGATWVERAEPRPELLAAVQRGYLVGDRFVEERCPASREPRDILARSERLALVPAEIGRFARVSAGRIAPGERLTFREEEMPLGPEDEVMAAFLDDRPTVDHIAGVPPALDAAFRLECWRRGEARRARERRRIEEARSAFRAEVEVLHGDGEARRRRAAHDFQGAAAAALGVGGANYLDHRSMPHPNEVAVQFRVDGERFECTCDCRTLRIIDAGICLVDELTDERGDGYFTLESLPGVIRQARDEGVLVIFRHLE